MRVFLIALVATFCESCWYDDLEGTWELEFTSDSYSSDVTQTCQKNEKLPYEVVTSGKYQFFQPDFKFGGKEPMVTNMETREDGFYTMVFETGFMMTIDGKKYHAFFIWHPDIFSLQCNKTTTGWFNIPEKLGEYPTKWGCFKATKISGSSSVMKNNPTYRNQDFKIPTKEDIKKMNENQDDYTSMKYPDSFYKKIIPTLKKWHSVYPKSRSSLLDPDTTSSYFNPQLPTSLDWRDKDHVNYVTPIRNQEQCGSCFSMASMAMYESRARIQTQSKWNPIFSPQNIVDCSTNAYNDGCDGGFAYFACLYGEDFGIVEERCDPYVAKDEKCPNTCLNKGNRTATYNTTFVGGYLGISLNESLIMDEILTNGPVAVAMYTDDGFLNYKHGVYVPTNNKNDNDWEETNHFVILIGWGLEHLLSHKITPYWIGKNSWGKHWGEEGFFRIIRGVDALSIESSVVSSHVLIT